MEFDYEIQADDYTAGQILYYKLIRKSRTLEPWFLGGFLLLVVALVERDRGLSPVLLGAIALWWMWAAIARRFPGILRRSFRKHYDKAGLKDKKYRASINEEGFQVHGENVSWQIRWPAVAPKGEDDSVFMFYSSGVVFIFAKRYLGDEQQQALRSLANLPQS